MTKNQIKFLSLAYSKPVTVSDVKKRLHLDQDAFYDLTSDIDNCFNFAQKPDYEQSLITLSVYGKEAVEQNRHSKMKDVFDFIVAVTAFAAFIKSFFF